MQPDCGGVREFTGTPATRTHPRSTKSLNGYVRTLMASKTRPTAYWGVRVLAALLGRVGARRSLVFAALSLSVALVAQSASAGTGWVTVRITPSPNQQPAQTVTSTPRVVGIVEQVDCSEACSWSETLAGLPTAEIRARAAGTDWVAYDLEGWKASYPDNTSPSAALRALRLVGQRAHADGFMVLMTPGLSMSSTSWSLKLAKDYVRTAATYGDMLDLQVEAWECHPLTFASFTKTFTSVARTAHPGIVVLINQVTKAGYCPTAIRKSWQDVRSISGGRWVWHL